MTSPRFTINPSALRPRGELVADAIRASILRGTFRPGDRLDQQEIADELTVSRIPVREALRTLDAEGLITIIPNKGAIVTERTCDELAELYFIRQVMEGAAAERAVVRIDDRTLKLLSDIIDRANQTDDFEELLILNNDFHIVTYQSYPQPHLVNYIQQLRNMVAPYNRLYLDTAGNRESAWNDHRKIYEALLNRDGAGAKAHTHRHLERVLESILDELKKHERCEE
jgi:DNA-binding GntR family transcriptional regulator